MFKKPADLCVLVLVVILTACNGNDIKQKNNTDMKDTFQHLETNLKKKDIKEEKTSFDFDGVNHEAYVAYDPAQKGKRPGIIVIPEWWGLNEYVKERAKMLAGLGYIAMAVDVYGNGAIGHNPTEAMALTKPYNEDPSLSKKIIDSAIEKFKTYPDLDPANIAVIGYCFGGSVAINAGKLGADVKAVVGLHPSLEGAKPIKDSVKAKFLLCNGADDQFEKDNFQSFKDEMDSAGVDYIFKVYPDAKHAFTSPKADENARKFGIPVGYNAAADSASWVDMKAFFDKVLK